MPPRLLVVCTANRCRSPMAAGWLAARLAADGVPAQVASAGSLEPGLAPLPDAVEAMAEIGVDISAHRSRRLTPGLLAGADLVAVMTRQHAVDAVVLEPSAWPKVFPLADLSRRAAQAGPPEPGTALADWIRLLHGARSRSQLLSGGGDDDVEDPIGQPLSTYRATRDRMIRLLEPVVAGVEAAADRR